MAHALSPGPTRSWGPTIADPIGAAFRPVAAGHVGEWCSRERIAVGARPGQDVVLVRRVGATLDRSAVLVERSLAGQVVVRRMQVVDVTGNRDAPGVLPRAVADTIASVDEVRIAQRRALRAEVGAPSAIAAARGLRERPAVPVGAFEFAEVAALAGSDAGHEERHVLRAGLHG
ncbi:MAG: hypothetical protein H3C59_12835 [Burkholderiaceae bacterium]|nr:hypothetical protein [Burkholderiaceae bacterium]